MPKKIATFGPLGPGTRLACISMETSFAYFLSFLFSPGKDLLYALGDWVLPAGNELSFFNFQLSVVLGLYIFTQVFRFISHLFFGHGFFDPLFGITHSHRFLSGRFLGGLKVVLDTLFFPLVIFHLSLKKGSSIVERWSGYQKWQVVSPGIFGHLGVFLAPFMVMLSLYSPLMMGLTLFDGVQLRTETKEKEVIFQPEDLAAYDIYTSELFGFKTLSSLDQGRFLFIPQFDFSRKQNSLKLRPYLLIYDKREKVYFEFQLDASLRMGALIQKSQQGFPFWDKSFSELSNTYSVMNEQQSRGETSFMFKAQACKELEELVRSSFSLSLNTLVDHTFRYGPFLKGFIEVRQSILGIVGPEIPPEVDLYKLGDSSFLRLRQLHDFSHRKKAVKQTYIPLCVTKAPVLTLTSDSNMPSAVSRRDFLRDFFQQAEWEFTNQISNPLPLSFQDINAFHLIDHAKWENLDFEKRKKLEKGMSYFYFEQANELLRLDGPKDEISKQFSRSLKRMIELIELNTKKRPALKTKDLIISLKKTLVAFNDQDLSYFDLTQENHLHLWEY